jgi:hypothetical protein
VASDGVDSPSRVPRRFRFARSRRQRIRAAFDSVLNELADEE